MAGNLKPCPFCGGEAVLQQDANEEYYVLCRKCQLLFGYCTDTWAEFETSEGAIEAWNRRASDAQGV